jgi:hypothetical protein
MSVYTGIYGRHAPSLRGGTRRPLLHLHDHPDGVDDAGHVAEQGEQAVDPEVFRDADLQQDADGRQDDGEQDLDDVGAAAVIDRRGHAGFCHRHCHHLPLPLESRGPNKSIGRNPTPQERA